MLDPAQLEVARQKLARLKGEVELDLDPGEDPADRFSEVLCEVLDGLAAVSGGRLRVRRVPGSGPEGRPSFSLRNVQYLAVPWGPELEPFLDLVHMASAGVQAEDAGLAPATVQVLMAPTCPNCPHVVAACIQVVVSRPQIRLEVVDVQHFSDLAGSVRSVPTVIVDGTWTEVGALRPDELLQVLRGRETSEHMPRALISMIEAGRLDEAVPLLQSEEALAALATLMQEGGLKERMGLMVLAEKALEMDHHLLDGAVPHLLPLLQSEDATLRGDTADLLGKIGAPGAREALSALLADENPDVREVAADALSELRQPS